MKYVKYAVLWSFLAGSVTTILGNRDDYEIIVDKQGVMRRSDTKEEVVYYGTNYTLPFAHAYRAMDMVGADRKRVIDLDVSHMKRLGFNGFRLHLWDAELSDSLGNLLETDHLDLLDYMIAQLEKEGIDIVLTAQTNFGNGYPEKNIDTGAFTYDFDKCRIHEDPKAQKIQENYLEQLASHVNPYTGKSYGKDKAIIAIEINNEPCHSGSRKEVTAYINRMEKALRKGGFDRIVLYNVSHNPDVTEAYYDANIQGTTYQWYPVGLVAGHQRKGNFLPSVDSYDIPWKGKMKNYDRLARFVYEFDPGDVLYSHLYPAIARTFRKEGFQWATQFAYDPTPIAGFNTEYQTHYLNLLYTPAKALSMMIAAEVMREVPRGQDYGSYPDNTRFGNFSVSYDPDLSTLNAPDKFYHTGSTTLTPVSPDSLLHIAGKGNSTLVKYPGTGAYFLDLVSTPKGKAWRLEVMPDVALTADPFEKTSLRKPIGALYYASHPITLSLPGIKDDFEFTAISENGATKKGRAKGGTMTVAPGVYLLGNDMAVLQSILEADPALANYSAPKEATLFANKNAPMAHVSHEAPCGFDSRDSLRITATILTECVPMKATVYPSSVSFWNEKNPLVEMTTEDGVEYTATISPDMHKGVDFSYNIVVEDAPGRSITYPASTEGTPLDWDVITKEYYEAKAADPSAPIVLLWGGTPKSELDYAMIPEEYNGWYEISHNAPVDEDRIVIKANPQKEGMLTLRRRVSTPLDSEALKIADKKYVEIKTGAEVPAGTMIAFTDSNGYCYGVVLESPTKQGDAAVYTVELSKMEGMPSLIIPAPYPTFLKRETGVVASESSHLNPTEIEFVDVRIPTRAGEKITLPISYILLR